MFLEIVLVLSVLYLFFYFKYLEPGNLFVETTMGLAVLVTLIGCAFFIVLFLSWLFCSSEEVFRKEADEKLTKIEYTEQLLIEKAKDEIDILHPSYEYEVIKKDYLNKVSSYNNYINGLKDYYEANGFRGWLFRNKTFVEDYEVITPITS